VSALPEADVTLLFQKRKVYIASKAVGRAGIVLGTKMIPGVRAKRGEMGYSVPQTRNVQVLDYTEYKETEDDSG
jgi:hypothetical protein